MMKKIWIVLVILVACMSSSFSVCAFSPYENYTYPAEMDGHKPEPQAYLPNGVLTGKSIGITDFANPSDIYISEEGRIYISDAGNNRIVVLDKELSLVEVITSFERNGVLDSLSSPSCVFVDGEEMIYIADTDNDRIVVLHSDYRFCREYTLPEATLLEGIDFAPSKVVVDHSGRMFVISPNCNKGMIGLDKDGQFNGFYGVLETGNTLDIFKYFATDEQRKTMEQSIPVAYSNMTVDDEGFVYTTVALTDISGGYNPDIFIRKLNPSGKDVLVRRGSYDIIGDVVFYNNGEVQENSSFVDITVMGDNCYSALDSRYGRIFTYDKDGNLLYVFGAKGQSEGQFSNPVSLAELDGTYFVLDRNYNQIVVFEPTEYGTLLLEAASKYSVRDYEGAEECYDKLLVQSVYSDVAYRGKGNCLYQRQEYAEALKYYKFCENRDMYIEVFKYYLSDLANRYFVVGMSTILGFIVIGGSIMFIRKRKKERMK